MRFADLNIVSSNFSHRGEIYRNDLVKNILNKSTKKNIFLSAPGGFGKTVAARQWMTSVRFASAQLTISPDDNDADIFYRHLASALWTLTGKKWNSSGGEITLDIFLEMLANLPARHSRVFLLIDDLHTIKNQDILNGFPLVVTSLPSYIRICITSRCEPSPQLTETGRFECLTQKDLVFSAEEVEWLGVEKGRELTPEQINHLLETTGGWAIYLSAILSSGQSCGIPQSLTKYMEKQVWEPWSREIKELLLKLAIPTEITPGLAERLCGQEDGQAILKRLINYENAFLSVTADAIYRFHDIFRDFLADHTITYLGEVETKRLNDIAAQWYYEQGDYLESLRFYIINKNHDGIIRCLKASNRYHESAGSLSVEARLHFTQQYVTRLPEEFILENPYLITRCAVTAYHSGNAGEFLRYLDMLRQRLPEIAARHPEHAATMMFVFGVDHRMSFHEYILHLNMPNIPTETAPKATIHVSTVTQNLPFFHRSMRDYSEYCELRDEDLALLIPSLSMMIGKDFDVMKEALFAGIYYERGELLHAARHALIGFHAYEDGMSPETLFSANMILAAVLYAMGAHRDADQIMKQTESFLKEKARFLYPNFKALQTERAIRAGDTDSVQEWLAVYANHTEQLPFYRMCQHFTTLRSYIALGDFHTAISFGKRLQALSKEYNRPLDQIESGLLMAVALWQSGEKGKGEKQMENTLKIAVSYGFTQLIVNESKDILPLLRAVYERKSTIVALRCFIEKLTGITGAKYIKQPVKLSPMRLKMLTYLEKNMSYNEIANATGLARGTVKRHILLLYKQLGVHSAEDAITKAKLFGFV